MAAAVSVCWFEDTGIAV